MSPHPIKRLTLTLAILGSFAMACANDSPPLSPPETGGTTKQTGGVSSTGGVTSTGGVATGGETSGTGGKATGGITTSTGGVSATGGVAQTGGIASTGGIANTGGTTRTGGMNVPATGGISTATGGTRPDAGAQPDAGTATGGTTATGDVAKSTGCGQTTTLKGESTKTISVGGTNRSYIIRLPDNYDSSKAHKLIFAIHPLNGTASGVAKGGNGTNYEYYGLWKLSQGSTIFVSPQGVNNAWSNSGGSDVTFIKTLYAEIEKTLCIDKNRVFAEGFSMGGSMSYSLACSMGGTIKAIAAHSGGPMSGCDKTNRKPVAYLMTHGTKDSVCTYPGYGVPQINDFAALNGCTAMDIPGTLKPTDSTGMTPVCADFKGCQAGFPARACVFVGDHTPSPGGEAKTWVPAETWKFFSQF